MNFNKPFKTLVTAASLAVAGSAFAATVDGVQSPGDSYYISASNGALTFTSDVTTSFALGNVAVTPIAPSTYNAPTVSGGIASFSFDDVSKAFTKISVSGGATMTVSSGGLTGGPGSLTLRNITIDPIAKQVLADVSGANGLTAGNYAFFNIGTVTGDTTFSAPGTYTFGAEGLTLSTQGLSLIKQGLALNNFGGNVLAGIKDFGTLSGTVTVAAAVPEPSTYALAAVGLLGVLMATRNRRRAA